jgi:thiamine-phosphate pyrophosphorylase
MSTQLYLITPPSIQLADFTRKISSAFSGGRVGSLQLRLKHASDSEVLEAAEVIRPMCHAHNTAFILNDRPDLAKRCGADGVHLGQDDLEQWPIKKARAAMGEEAVIGVSCHASRHLAMEAGEQGADYVAFGAFYPTKSKPKEKIEKWGVPQPELLTWWQEMTTIPCVAIGGITAENCGPLVKAGADFIAAITYVWEHSDSPGEAVRALNNVLLGD